MVTKTQEEIVKTAIESLGGRSGIVLTFNPTDTEISGISTGIFGYCGDSLKKALPEVLFQLATQILKENILDAKKEKEDREKAQDADESSSVSPGAPESP